MTPYGSFVTGVGSTGSDVDLSVSPGVASGTVGQKDSALMDTLVECLSQDPAFRVLARITTSKCPILSLTHIATRTKCEISTNNELSIRNTELVAAYTALSPVGTLLQHALRAWVTAHKLLMSGYSVSLLVIFYLQQQKLVPNLQAGSSGAQRVVDHQLKRKADGEEAAGLSGRHEQDEKRRKVGAAGSGGGVESASANAMPVSSVSLDTAFETKPAIMPSVGAEQVPADKLLLGLFEYYGGKRASPVSAIGLRTGSPRVRMRNELIILVGFP